MSYQCEACFKMICAVCVVNENRIQAQGNSIHRIDILVVFLFTPPYSFTNLIISGLMVFFEAFGKVIGSSLMIDFVIVNI